MLTDLAALFVPIHCVTWRKPHALSVSVPCLPWERSQEGPTCLELQNAFQSCRRLLSSGSVCSCTEKPRPRRVSLSQGLGSQGESAGRKGGIPVSVPLRRWELPALRKQYPPWSWMLLEQAVPHFEVSRAEPTCQALFCRRACGRQSKASSSRSCDPSMGPLPADLGPHS